MHDNLEFHLEGLENREMLAVDVSLSGSGRLKIVGDSDANNIGVEGTGTAGQVDVYVEGVYVDTFSGVRSINASTKRGDDAVHVSAIDILGDLKVRTGKGADKFDLDTTSATYDGPVSIGGNVTAVMFRNAGDYVEWDCNDGANEGITIGGDVTLRGAADIDFDGDGGSSGLQSDDITIMGNFVAIISSFGNVGGSSAEIRLDDVNVGGDTRIFGSNGGEEIQIGDSFFAGLTSIWLRGGDDTLDFVQSDPSVFDGAAVFNGGTGTDTTDDLDDNTFNEGELTTNFELATT